MNEEKERSEKRAEEWMTQKRQERLKEETVNAFTMLYVHFCSYSTCSTSTQQLCLLFSSCLMISCFYIHVHVGAIKDL